LKTSSFILLAHHDLHHLHHWVYLSWNSSFSFVLEKATLICALSSKFAIWMNIDASFAVGAFWEKLAIFRWMMEWALCVCAAWVESASNFLLTSCNCRCSWSLWIFISSLSFHKLNLWLNNFLIACIESISSF